MNSNSKPDIELLAPIARPLDISLDTLLSFHEKLSDTEIEEIIRKMEMCIRDREKDVPEFKKLLVQYYEGEPLEVIGAFLKERCWKNF